MEKFTEIACTEGFEALKGVFEYFGYLYLQQNDNHGNANITDAMIYISDSIDRFTKVYAMANGVDFDENGRLVKRARKSNGNGVPPGDVDLGGRR
jgi:hypothetical protein